MFLGADILEPPHPPTQEVGLCLVQALIFLPGAPCLDLHGPGLNMGNSSFSFILLGYV